MEGDNPTIADRLKIVEDMKRFMPDDEMYARIYGDLHDLIGISERFLAEIEKRRAFPLSVEDTERFLIDLKISYVDHSNFHLRSLGKEISKLLKNLSQMPNDRV